MNEKQRITNQVLVSDLAKEVLSSNEGLRNEIRAMVEEGHDHDLETFQEKMVEAMNDYLAGLDESLFEKILDDDRERWHEDLSQSEYERVIANTY